jgi:hypothetical protein
LSLIAVNIDRTALDVLHHEVRQSIGGRAGVEEARDVRVVQICEDLHLVSEAPPDNVAAETGLDQLDRDLLSIVFVIPLGQVDGAHSSAPDLAHNAVRADTTARFRGLNFGFKRNASRIRDAHFQGIVAGIELMS